MNKRCEHKDGLGYRCGSYAFNLYKEKIEQGDRCDRHYWQDQAMKAAAQEREECAKLCDDLDDDLPDGLAGWQYGEAIRARGTT